MKKIVTLVVLLVGFTYGSLVMAGVDLQPRNVFYATIADQNRNGRLEPGLYVNIQNNGPDDFQGTFTISYADDGERPSHFITYSGTIGAGNYEPVRLSSQEAITYIKVDSKDEISETNEMNNDFCLQVNESQVRITSSWTGIIAENYYPTLYVLPNEYFFQQFSLSELSNRKLDDARGSIIGFSFSFYAFNFPGSEIYYSEVQSRWPEGTYVDGNLIGGKYSFYSDRELDRYHTSCEWMANSSSAAIDYFWLGDFQGTTRGMAVGSEANIFINATIALRDLTSKSDGFNKTIKVIDRIRGDVNDDGVVDQADLDILSDVVSHGLYNPCMSFKNMYQERGMNYGAGIIMFSVPDFLSNCLINIWINDHNDPLVQGLGIGELMSKGVDPNYNYIRGVKNSFSVSGEDLSIDAPEADLYNVTAQKADGKLFQVTGRMGEQIKVPAGAKNVRVETVKVKHEITALITPKNSINVSVYPTKISDYVNVKYSGKGNVQVLNLSGQTIFASPLKSDEELKIETGSWSNGVYIVNVTSAAGTKSTKVIK